MVKSKKQWWETLFDEKYIKTYVDIVTPALTTQQISFILKQLRLKPGAKILDLACGAGRHAIELAKHGYSVTGLDFSKHSLDIAKKEAKTANIDIELICKDMRKLSFSSKFDVITNLFTSFGYFDDEKDNERVLQKVFRALKPKGQFLIDINNSLRTLMWMCQTGKVDKRKGCLTSIQRNKCSNGLLVTSKHEWNAATMRWSMTRTWKEKGKQKSYRTNVRLFSLTELSNMLERNGLYVEKVWGDFQGSAFSFDSPRLILLAKKF